MEIKDRQIHNSKMKIIIKTHAYQFQKIISTCLGLMETLKSSSPSSKILKPRK